MRDVDYEDWADFIDAIIQEHRPDTVSILELACGTGKIAMFLDELECYEITATDLSAEMIEIGKTMAEFRDMSIQWDQQDFYNITLEEQYDAVLALFDSINYILKEEEMLKMLSSVARVMHEDSIFIFDFTTPAHSEFVADKLNDEGVTPDNIRFERRNFYIPSEKIHVNEFELEFLDKDKVTVLRRAKETHRQRIYDYKEMKQIIAKSDFDILAAYEDFDFVDATNKSERITLVLKCRKNQ